MPQLLQLTVLRQKEAVAKQTSIAQLPVRACFSNEPLPFQMLPESKCNHENTTFTEALHSERVKNCAYLYVYINALPKIQNTSPADNC